MKLVPRKRTDFESLLSHRRFELNSKSLFNWWVFFFSFSDQFEIIIIFMHKILSSIVHWLNNIHICPSMYWHRLTLAEVYGSVCLFLLAQMSHGIFFFFQPAINNSTIHKNSIAIEINNTTPWNIDIKKRRKRLFNEMLVTMSSGFQLICYCAAWKIIIYLHFYTKKETNAAA